MTLSLEKKVALRPFYSSPRRHYKMARMVDAEHEHGALKGLGGPLRGMMRL